MSARKLACALEGLTERQATNREIVTNICDAVRDGIVRNIREYPEDWDGHEMRALIERFMRDYLRTPAMSDRRSKRYRIFEGEYLAHCGRWKDGS